MDFNLPLDQEIARKYLQFLLSSNKEDSIENRQEFCESSGVHAKFIYFNPHIKAITQLTTRKSNLERHESMNLREYMQYHYYFIHQAYRYGAPEQQQKWLGHPIVKSPFDCWIYQEIISEVKPDIVLELGVLFGGGTRFFASILDLVGHGQLIGVDVSLDKIKGFSHPRVTLIEGSSTSSDTFERIKKLITGKKLLVIADSDHEKRHVRKEIELYAPFVPVGSYFVVEDSVNDVMGHHPVPNEGPQAAAKDYLVSNGEFIADTRWAERYILSLNPYGYLRRVK